MPRMIVVANRLPVRRVGGEWTPSPGGLVSSLTPILQAGEGVWIGWSGTPGEDLGVFSHDGIRQVPIRLDRTDVDDYYLGFSNASIWPLFHDAVRTPEFHRTWWSRYRSVNRRFAEAAAEVAEPGDIVWVQDYHLQLVPQMLRELSPDVRIGFYLHIPFPPIEIYARLPWRRQILEGLGGADLVGFQTELARRNFHLAAEMFSDGGQDDDHVRLSGRRTRTITAPISIDVADFERLATSDETTERTARVLEELGNPRRVILGVDRLDYTKGIDVRLMALETLLDRHPRIADDTVFVQVAVPSREALGDYEEMRQRIEGLVGRINGIHGRALRAPVNYMYGSLPREQLVAYYRAADVMVITPLRDGMNLIAKEYVVSRPETGVLVLSEFAGVANELPEALLVNPYDIDGMADAFHLALELPPDEQRRRMRSMRDRVRTGDVHHWAARFLDALS